MPIGELTGLPAGQYVVTAKAQFDLLAETDSFVFCTLTLSDGANQTGPFVDTSAASLNPPIRTTLPFSVAGDIPSGGTAVLNCDGNSAAARSVKITAIQVGSLTVMP
jgi:hypothetical protein